MKPGQLRLLASGCLLAFACAFAPTGSRAQEPGAAFARVAEIDTVLARGKSTRGDVERLLGKPTGRGAAMLPPEHRAHEIWYYESLRIRNMKGEGQGRLRIEMDQRVLLVFIDDGLFDGYLWFSNAGLVTPR